MKKLILFTLLPLFSFSQITWSWTDAETGLDKGTFVTNGTLNEDGTVSSGTYTISDFTLDQTSTPISTSGSFANGDWVLSQPDIGFIWSGSYVTEFWRSSGGYTNGLNIYTQGYTHGISMSIDYFAISQGEDNFLVSQSTTPLVAPLNSETDSDIKLNGTVSAESNQIKNVAEPTEAKDAATKGYVDTNVNAFSGSYNDLTDTPTTITTQQATDISTNSAKVTFPGFGTTAGTALEGNTALFSGSYNDLTDKPTTYTQAQVDALIQNLQIQIDGLTPPQGTAAINHTNKTYSGVSCEGLWLGFKFSVSETQTITALGAWDEGHNVDVNNEFSSCPDASNFSVPIAIYKNDVLVLEKVINASTGFVIGSSRYIKIDDFVLTPGDEYFIIGNYEGSSKYGYFDSNLVSSNYDSRITPLTVTSSPLFSKNTNGDGTFPSNLTTLPDNQWSDQYFHVNFLLKN